MKKPKYTTLPVQNIRCGHPLPTSAPPPIHNTMSTSESTSTSTSTSSHKHHSSPQTLTIPFQVTDRGPAIVHATITPVTNPNQHGINLLNLYTDPSTITGYPSLHATVTSHSSLGYATLYGWIQFTHTPGEDWVMDLYPPFQALNSPFSIWGADPTVVDCPGREGVREYDWSAQDRSEVLRYWL